jgi:hypothetical protein
VCLLVLWPGLQSTFAGTTDFMSLYAGAKLAFTNQQYNPARVLATQLHDIGYASQSRLFVRLPVFGLVIWPIAQLPYQLAWPIWEAMSLFALAGFLVVWPLNRGIAVVACCWSLPLWMSLAEGQDITFLLLWIALALSILERRPFVAGVLLSLCAAKFHLFLLLPLWMVANRLWHLASGFAVGVSLFLTACFLAGGHDWPRQYIALFRNPGANPYLELMPNLHGQFHNLLSFEVIGAVAVAVIVWFAIRNLNRVAGLAPVLIGGVLIAPHAYMADCALFVIALLILLSNALGPVPKALCLFLLTPVPYAALMLHESLCVIVPALTLLITLALAEPAHARSPQPRSGQYPSIAADSHA